MAAMGLRMDLAAEASDAKALSRTAAESACSSKEELSTVAGSALDVTAPVSRQTTGFSASEESFCDEPSSIFEAQYLLSRRVLGEGASGAVYGAVCRETGQKVAVKAYAKEGMSAKQIEGLRSEVEIHSSLDHPNVVKLEDAFWTPESATLVMEQLEGGEVLDRVLDEDRFSEVEAADVMAQTLQVLAYLHAQKIAHRDVKPDNLVFTQKSGRSVKMIDFGFSARVGSEGLTSQCGSLGYVAPEVVSGRAYDERCDCWSAGSLMYFMLTGQTLFEGDQMEVLRKTRSFKEPEYGAEFESFSPAAQDLLNGLLRADPAKRLTAAEALEHPWLSCAAAEETVALEPAAACEVPLFAVASVASIAAAIAVSNPASGVGLGPLLLGFTSRYSFRN